MATMLKASSNVVSTPRPSREPGGPSSSSLQQNGGCSLVRHLSRTITQPLCLYEALNNAYGPIIVPDDLQAELPEIDEAFNSLPASCSSDTETCSSHEEGLEIHPEPVHDQKNGPESRLGADSTAQSARSRKKGETHRHRSDEEWAKSILGRRTGYGCTQRNLVGKYISQLETNVAELQTEVSKLSPQIVLFDEKRWILQDENEALKEKIAEAERYQGRQADENEKLEKELQELRAEHADLLQAEKKRQEFHVEDKLVRQLSLVKWPSTLYRSVSAIRKDVLEVGIEIGIE